MERENEKPRFLLRIGRKSSPSKVYESSTSGTIPLLQFPPKNNDDGDGDEDDDVSEGASRFALQYARSIKSQTATADTPSQFAPSSPRWLPSAFSHSHPTTAIFILRASRRIAAFLKRRFPHVKIAGLLMAWAQISSVSFGYEVDGQLRPASALSSLKIFIQLRHRARWGGMCEAFRAGRAAWLYAGDVDLLINTADGVRGKNLVEGESTSEHSLCPPAEEAANMTAAAAEFVSLSSAMKSSVNHHYGHPRNFAEQTPTPTRMLCGVPQMMSCWIEKTRHTEPFPPTTSKRKTRTDENTLRLLRFCTAHVTVVAIIRGARRSFRARSFTGPIVDVNGQPILSSTPKLKAHSFFDRSCGRGIALGRKAPPPFAGWRV